MHHLLRCDQLKPVTGWSRPPPLGLEACGCPHIGEASNVVSGWEHSKGQLSWTERENEMGMGGLAPPVLLAWGSALLRRLCVVCAVCLRVPNPKESWKTQLLTLETKALETPSFLHMRKFCSLNTQMFSNEKSLFWPFLYAIMWSELTLTTAWLLSVATGKAQQCPRCSSGTCPTPRGSCCLAFYSYSSVFVSETLLGISVCPYSE